MGFFCAEELLADLDKELPPDVVICPKCSGCGMEPRAFSVLSAPLCRMCKGSRHVDRNAICACGGYASVKQKDGSRACGAGGCVYNRKKYQGR